MKNLSKLLLAIWLIVMGAAALIGADFPYSDLLLPLLAIVAGVLIFLGLRYRKIRNNLGLLLLGIWLILVGALSFLSLSLPFLDVAMPVLAIVAGVLLLLPLLGDRWYNDLGMLLLCIWLILSGAAPLLSAGFAHADALLNLLAVVTGVLLLIRR
ncbi:MAG: hypothetical protein JXA78_11890 [Anaerolineales bacterium]|nr:hypothetical protein [Anaerolineales bacterium]